MVEVTVMGISTTLGELKQKQKDELIKFYVEKKWSLSRIAKRYGYSTKEDGIELLERHAIPIRTRSRNETTDREYIMAKHNGKWVPEHRLVWEQANGPIPKGWIIRRLNGIMNDNRLENLISVPRTKHSTILIIEATKNRIISLENQVKQLEEVVEMYEEYIRLTT